jgi:hypothetical protein
MLGWTIIASFFGTIGLTLTHANAQENVSRSATSGRRIPVRSYSPAPATQQPRVLKEKPGIQPGQVTSVEIRNEAGEIVSEELQENEYFIGAAPPPITVGQRIPAQMASSPTMAFDSRAPIETEVVPLDGLTEWDESVMLSDPLSGSCDSCGSAGGYASDAGCESCGHGYGQPIDPRVEHIARLIANPLTGFWVRAEYLHLLLDGQGVPSLVTTSEAGTLRADAGKLGLLSTTTLYGNDTLGEDERSGGRFEIGRYFGNSGLALSASFLFAEDVDEQFSANSANFGILARPFVNVGPGGLGNDAELISFPGLFTGNIDVQSSTSFSAGDVLLRAILICQKDRQLEGFIGYSYLNLDDDLSIRDFRRAIGGASGLAVGTTIEESDRFSTENHFNAAAMGVRSQTCFGGWSLSSMLKLGIGVTSSTSTAAGSTTTSVPLPGGTDVATRNSGLLVQDTNSGSRDYDEFAVSPELRLLLSRRLDNDWSVSVGYHFLYLSRVLRAGEQIDPLINPSQLAPGGLQGFAAPRRDAFYNDLTAQALTLGLLREF